MITEKFIPLSLSSIRILVGPLGRARASRPFVPPSPAQTANQAAAAWPLHCETPFLLALTFDPLPLFPQTPKRPGELGWNVTWLNARHNPCFQDSAPPHRLLEHQGFPKQNEETLLHFTKVPEHFPGCSGRRPTTWRWRVLIMDWCGSRVAITDVVSLDGSLPLVTEPTQHPTHTHTRTQRQDVGGRLLQIFISEC